MPVMMMMSGGCMKDKLSNGPLYFSQDTLTFDTVFTTLGSTTQSFKVYNHNKYPVKINNIQLAHLEGQQFRINVDGVGGSQFSNVQIPGHDSIYVFVEVTVNPNDVTTPFVIIDDVNFTIGNTTQTVYLQAFGQNAHFHYGTEIKAGQSVTWNNDLPHVVMNYDSVPGVLVDCGATLNIRPGCKIYMAANSAIFVEGTLNALSSDWNDSIVFRGVRLESYYDDLPGQWFGIVFLRNGGCTPIGHFSHCILNESSYGIYAGAGTSTNTSDYQNPEQNATVTLDKTIVKNTQYNAIYGFNANITATNSMFFTAGDYMINLTLGGNYSFTNCTMYNEGSVAVSHQKQTLLLSNAVSDANNNVFPAPLTTKFNNCVIYGNLPNEILFANYDDSDLARFNNSFTYCLLQTPGDTFNTFTTVHTGNIFNVNPNFYNPGNNDFTPSDSMGYFSPLIDFCPGGLNTDIFDHVRPVSKTSNANKYDIGAIELQ
jgi:hypothetical protein